MLHMNALSFLSLYKIHIKHKAALHAFSTFVHKPVIPPPAGYSYPKDETIWTPKRLKIRFHNILALQTEVV